MDQTTREHSRQGAEGPAAIRGPDARRAFRLRQRVSRPRLPEPAPAVPPSVDDLAVRAGSDRSAAGRAGQRDRSRGRAGHRRRAARAHDRRSARQPPQPDASALQLRAVQPRPGRRLHAAPVLSRRDPGQARAAGRRRAQHRRDVRALRRARRSEPARRCWRRSKSTIAWKRSSDIGVPNIALAEYQAPENYKAAECPLCKAGVPITRF